MKRLLVTMSVLALAACGGSETGQTQTKSETTPAAAEAPQAAKAPQATEAAPATTAQPMPDTHAQHCLDLVAAGKFEEALPMCLAALKVDPTNQQVRDAVDQARAETAKATAAAGAAQAAGGAATDEAAGAATEAAKSKLGEATQGLPGSQGE